ncbi:MAG: hypothetical protein HN736_14780 [Anaerolineae bacterium]|jgi:hypothetical protein|nr:hypothetical protein [Anaerolineae bacterium]MBT7483579.1 hypothetical protein [Candidatus Peregrinibacteria bacterium]MBT3714118.1 hypothetical protein [Anaerolineae bacterium]MBT4310846.1 hypothetical protein [Anaerolineae bacterium]MBT4458481.1 hypothetical protein [Anaerolineae bacterium]
MAPVVHGLEVQYFGLIDFTYLDVDDAQNAALMKEFEFRYQPMFVLVDGNGAPVKTWFGAVHAGEFETEFAKVIN